MSLKAGLISRNWQHKIIDAIEIVERQLCPKCSKIFLIESGVPRRLKKAPHKAR